MNRVRECIGSSSGLAPMRQGLGWGVSLLAGLVMLLGINNADADRIYCGDISWIQCFDCSSNSEHPICARADADPAEPEAKYLYCPYALGRVLQLLYRRLLVRVHPLFGGRAADCNRPND